MLVQEQLEDADGIRKTGLVRQEDVRSVCKTVHQEDVRHVCATYAIRRAIARVANGATDAYDHCELDSHADTCVAGSNMLLITERSMCQVSRTSLI